MLLQPTDRPIKQENEKKRNIFKRIQRENIQLESLPTILTECIFRQRRITETCMQSLNHTAIHNTAQNNTITRKYTRLCGKESERIRERTMRKREREGGE